MSFTFKEKDNFNVISTGNNYKHAVIMIHGYGSSKDDLTSLVPYFSNLKDTIFFVPNGTFSLGSNEGYYWFPIDFSGGIAKMNIFDCKQAINFLEIFINNIVQDYKIPYKNISIFGFSQGAVMALYLGLLLNYTFSSIVAHSGLFFDYSGTNLKELINNFNKNQNILLIHGKVDNVVPFEFAEKTVEFFNYNKIIFSTFFLNNLGHNVDKESITKTEDFIKKNSNNL